MTIIQLFIRIIIHQHKPQLPLPSLDLEIFKVKFDPELTLYCLLFSLNLASISDCGMDSNLVTVSKRNNKLDIIIFIAQRIMQNEGPMNAAKTNIAKEWNLH